MEVIWRRFKPIGTDEDMEKLDKLLDKKKITRADLILILKCLELNKTVLENEPI